MADPFTIIGLTASIVSFIDFSLKIVSSGRSLFNSSHDTTKELQELGYIVDDIRKKNKELQELEKNSTRKPHKDETQALFMAKVSDELAEDLEKILNTLKKRPGKSRLYESGRIAVQHQVKAADIKTLRTRLLTLNGLVRENMKSAIEG